jgi:methionyl-tRNA formyltransferase
LLLLSDGIDVAFAALSRPHAVGARRLRRRLGTARVLDRPDVTRPEIRDRLVTERVDLVVSWFWTTRLPRALLDAAPLGSVGVHPSLLPRHRGPDPYFWAIDSGDAVTGVTAHRLAEAYDTGAILAQRTLSIDPSWNAWTLAKRLDRPSLSLLREVVGKMAAGERMAERPQDEANATEAPEPQDALLALSWEQPATAVVRRVRAASPWPGAFTSLGDSVVTITHAEVTDDTPRALEPGEATVRPDGLAVVRAKDAGVVLLAGRDEDDRPVGPGDFARIVAGAVVPFGDGVL